RRARDERRGGEPDPAAAGGQARAGRGPRHRGAADRDAGDLPRRGERRAAARAARRDPGVPRGGGGAAAVRGGRDPPSGAGPGGPRGGAAIALTTDTSLLTACGNDLGFDEIFARQIEALARPGDLVVLHSTSGESPNVLRAAQAARAKGVGVVALLGRDGGAARELVDDCLVIPTH